MILSITAFPYAISKKQGKYTECYAKDNRSAKLYYIEFHKY